MIPALVLTVIFAKDLDVSIDIDPDTAGVLLVLAGAVAVVIRSWARRGSNTIETHEDQDA